VLGELRRLVGAWDCGGLPLVVAQWSAEGSLGGSEGVHSLTVQSVQAALVHKYHRPVGNSCVSKGWLRSGPQDSQETQESLGRFCVPGVASFLRALRSLSEASKSCIEQSFGGQQFAQSGVRDFIGNYGAFVSCYELAVF
jgi:hypothetical protein